MCQLCTSILSDTKRTRHAGTVRDVSNPAKIAHLRALEGAAERLTIVQADLLDETSIATALAGADVCFHTASPFFNGACADPEAELLRPARDGTLVVLHACKQHGIKQVVLTRYGAVAVMSSNSLPIYAAALKPAHPHPRSPHSSTAAIMVRDVSAMGADDAFNEDMWSDEAFMKEKSL